LFSLCFQFEAKIQKIVPGKAMLAGMRPAEKFLFVVVVLFILGLAFQFLGAFLAAWIYAFSFTDILSLRDYGDPGYVAATKLIQIVGSIGTFIVPAFLFSVLFAGDPYSYYGFRNPVAPGPLLLTVLMMVSIIPFINYTAELNLRMELPFEALEKILRDLEGQAEEMMVAFTDTKTLWGLLVNLLMIGVIAAVGEELIFRGVVQRLIMAIVKNVHLAIVITAIFFSAFHFQFFSFLPRFVLGMVLGYLMYYGRSIWYPILAHFINNAMGVTYYYFSSKGSADDMLEEIGTSTLIPVAAVISLVLFIFFLVLWYYQVRLITSLSPQSGKTEKE